MDPTPLLSIGVVDGDAPYLFDRIGAVRLFPDGRVAVADVGSADVRIFTADGAFERRIGRSGSGPGEFGYITGMWIEGSDTLGVYDFRSLRLSRFVASGELLTSLTFRAGDVLPQTHLARLSDGTHLILGLKSGGALGSVPVADSVLFGRFEGDSLRGVVAVAEGMRRIGVQSPSGPGYTGPLPFSPHPLSAMVGDTLFFSDGLGGRVRAVWPVAGGTRTFAVELRQWSPEDATVVLEPLLDSVRARQFPALMEAPASEAVPTVSDMLADSESLLWLKEYDPATDSHAIGRPRTGGEWIVIRTDGTMLARVALPDGFLPMEIGRDRIAGVSRDEYGVERAVVYGLSRD